MLVLQNCACAILVQSPNTCAGVYGWSTVGHEPSPKSKSLGRGAVQKYRMPQLQTSQYCGIIYPRWPLWHPLCMLLPSEVKQSRTHSADWAMNLALWTVPWIKPNQPKRVMETARNHTRCHRRAWSYKRCWRSGILAEGVIKADDFPHWGINIHKCKVFLAYGWP